MILQAIELCHVGRFGGRARIGPFDRGLNVIAAANEVGKTTLVRAAVRCLFDKPSTRDPHILALQPAGTDLAPEITLEFEYAGRRHQLQKRFLHRPTCKLSEWRDGRWQLVAEEDRAHQRVLEMLGAQAPGRGASKPEHWGLIRYLWARQGEPAHWPEWAGPSGDRIRQSLARVEIDPRGDQLRTALQEVADELFTSTGRVRAGSELDRVQKRIRETDGELMLTRERLEQLEAGEARYAQLAIEMQQAEREREKHRAEAERLAQQLHQLEVVRRDIELAEQQHQRANERLQTIAADRGRLAEWQEQLDASRAQLQTIGNQLAAMETELQQAEQRLAAAQQARTEAAEICRQAESHAQQQRRLLDWRRRLQEVDRLRRQLERVQQIQHRRAELQEERARLPRVTDALLDRFTELESQAQKLSVRLESAGLEVRLDPQQPCPVEVTDESGTRTVEADSETVLRARRRIKLRLPEWGGLDICSGAQEVADLQSQLESCQRELDQIRQQLGVSRATDAARQQQQATLLDQEIRSQTEQLRQALDEFDSDESLREALAQAQSEAERLQSQLGPEVASEELEGASLERLQAAFAEAEARWRNARERAADADKDWQDATSQREQRVQRLHELKQQHSRLEAALDGLQQRMQSVHARYTEGIESAYAKAQEQFVQAEAKLRVARQQLPPEAELLPQRHERALRAATEAERRCQQKRDERHRLEGALGQDAAAGLHARAIELEEQLEHLRRQAATIERRGRAARLMAELLEQRKQLAIHRVLEPLEQELSSSLAQLTGVPNRRVFLDENLAVVGVGPSRDTAHPFELLSQGAREQLLLALRGAVARHLSADEPQALILDDVLVNTDPVRQVRVLDYLVQLAQYVQIIVLTCHPDRYAGVGCQLEIIEAD